MKYLREKYKTVEGARKRCAFENGVALSEFRSGRKARWYKYRTEQHDGFYRVARYTPDEIEKMVRANGGTFMFVAP